VGRSEEGEEVGKARRDEVKDMVSRQGLSFAFWMRQI
jgi:hypothetical protein